jgi:hypothetical protein
MHHTIKVYQWDIYKVPHTAPVTGKQFHALAALARRNESPAPVGYTYASAGMNVAEEKQIIAKAET